VNPRDHCGWWAALGSAGVEIATLPPLAWACVRFRGVLLAANVRALRTVNLCE
jgi:hypothetical protein